MTAVDVAALVAQTTSELTPLFDAMEWAEDEIRRATDRHPKAWDLLFHSFSLLQAGDGMGVEFVYRSHARELLERVAAGEDTRPGTAAEVVLLCSRASAVAPFHTSAVGLYLRMWATAFPDRADVAGSVLDREHYEALRSDEIDDLEAVSRRKTAARDRRLALTELECRGQHHGEPAPGCRFVRRQVVAQPALFDQLVAP